MITHLSPYIQRKIWGGKRLAGLKGLQDSEGHDPIGETWEISIHHEGTSFCSSDGKLLNLAPHESKLPYLVKLIDTNEELSVQVHPDDEYALKHEQSTGKSECWFILDAKKDAGIYLGLKPFATKENFISALKNNEKMSEYLNFYKVTAGEFFYVPAGSIHAIGGGITLAEVQQNSGITYRVWDWNRVDQKGNPRELHINKSLDVINFDPEANVSSHFKRTTSLLNNRGQTLLIDHKSFKLSLINLQKGEELKLQASDKNRFPSLLSIGGIFKVNDQLINNFGAALVQNEKDLHFIAQSDCSFLFVE